MPARAPAPASGVEFSWTSEGTGLPWICNLARLRAQIAMEVAMWRTQPALLMLLLVACGAEAPDPAEIPAGVWSGSDARATVGASGAAFAFHCAAGSAPNPLTLDADGEFDLAGSYELQAGPEPYRQQAARFRGQVRGRTMTLEVRMDDGSRAQGPTELVLGASESQLRRCR